MLIHFSKRHHLSICSGSMRIKVQILPFILVVADFEVSPAITSSATTKFSSFASTSSSPIIFFFSLFLLIHSDLYWVKLYYLNYLFSSFLSSILRIFGHIYFVFLVLMVLSFLSCRFSEFPFLVFCLCWTYYYTVLIGRCKLPTAF